MRRALLVLCVLSLVLSALSAQAGAPADRAVHVLGSIPEHDGRFDTAAGCRIGFSADLLGEWVTTSHTIGTRHWQARISIHPQSH